MAYVLPATADELELAAAALEAEARRRQKAATRAAGELMEEVQSGRTSDKRPGAVRIASVLAEANGLESLAGRLRSAVPIEVSDEELQLQAARAELGIERVAPRSVARRLLGRSSSEETSEVLIEDDEEPVPPVADPDADESDPDVIALSEEPSDA